MKRCAGLSRFMRQVAWVLGVLCGVTAFVDLSAADMAQEDIKQLVVMVEAKLSGLTNTGAGIIFGVGDDSLYIATANHVVRDGNTDSDEVWVRFKWSPNRLVKATLMRHTDVKLDLAVLRVEGLNAIAARPDALPFERVRDPSSLKRGDDVYLLGYPLVKAWRMNTTPEKFAEKTGDLLDFESNFIARGHSGGALLDEHLDLVGMLKSDTPPYGEAVSIAGIMETLRQWRLPVNLGRQPMPNDFSFVSAGRAHACGLTTTKTIYCWGSIGTAGIGKKGSRVFSSSPVRIPGGLIFQSVSAGAYYSCGVSDEGAAYCWGNNGYSQLGTDSNENSELPVPVSGGLNFRLVSAGDFFTCGITVSGAAYCWGSPGEVPGWRESPDRVNKPTLVPGKLLFQSVSPNEFGACGVTTGGAAYCWGPEVGGKQAPESRDPIALLKGIKFESASHNCLLAASGVVYCWQEGTDPAMPEPTAIPGGLKFRSISGETWHACGITVSGAVYCWGFNVRGELGNGSKIHTESGHLTSKDLSPPSTVSGGLKFQSVSVGFYYTCGVAIGGTAYCWGVLGAINDASPEEQEEQKDYGTVPAAVVSRQNSKRPDLPPEN